MSNGEVCCILGLCCPVGSAAQLDATVHLVQKHRPDWSKDRCTAAAQRLLMRYGYFVDASAAVEETPEPSEEKSPEPPAPEPPAPEPPVAPPTAPPTAPPEKPEA